jgi:hypothetical protein
MNNIRLETACKGKNISASKGGLNIFEFKEALKKSFKELGVNRDSEIDKITLRQSLEALCSELKNLKEKGIPVPLSIITSPVPATIRNGIIEYVLDDIEGKYTGQIKNNKPEGKGKIVFYDSMYHSYDGEWTDGKMNGEGTLIYNNKYKSETFYKGQFNNNMKNGVGKMKHVNGDIYEGEWTDNMKNGKGKMKYVNGDIYEGEWTDEMKNGKGKMTYENGNIYEGEWTYNMKNGKGEMTYNNGYYEGDWKNDMRDGKGKMTYTYGDVYEGDWKNDMMNGKGKMTNVIGVYEGDFEDDFRNGKGKMTYTDGNIYEGDWKYNKRDGKGKMTYENGDVYEGEWKNNEKDGYGTMIQYEGDVYVGEWKNDFRDGNGTLTNYDGTIYEGEWKNNIPNGYGKIEYSNGDLYIGQVAGIKQGKGKMTYAIGNFYSYDGDWVNNKMDGKGTLIYSDRITTYTGSFSKNNRNGIGKMVYSDGNIYEGTWVNDKKDGAFKITYKNGMIEHVQYKDNNKIVMIMKFNNKDEYSQYLKKKLPSINVKPINDFENGKTHNKCSDIINFTTYNIEKLLNLNPNKIVIIYYDPTNNVINENNIYCYSYSYFHQILTDNKRKFFMCKGTYYEDKDEYGIGDRNLYNNSDYYVKIDLSFPVYIHKKEYDAFLEVSHYTPYFYIIPQNKKYSHTITLDVLNYETGHVSENHCQSRTNIDLHSIFVCNDPKTCVKTFLKDIIKYKVFIEDINAEEPDDEEALIDDE